MFEFPILLQIAWTSVATSTYYVLFAIAFALTLKVTRVWNFVQAGVMGVAFYGMFAAIRQWNWHATAGFAFGLALAVALAIVVEIFGYRVLKRRRSSALLLFIFAIVVAEFIAYLRFTRQGQYMSAVADNASLAELYGISANRAMLAAMTIAAALVSVGVYLYGTRASMIPSAPLDLMLLAVIATILGGLGSLPGAAAAAVFLSLLQSGSILFIPSQWQSSLTYFVLFVVILFFPTGFRLPARLRRR